MPHRSRSHSRSHRTAAVTATATVVIALAYGAVVLALTTLKAFYRIGLLWVPERQRVRDLSLIPWDNALGAQNWFSAVFDTVGNVALFVPIGFLAALAVTAVTAGPARPRRPILKAVACGLALSLAVETIQYVFVLGRSDTGDLITNTLGTLLGAWLGCHRVLHRAGVIVIGLAVVAFGVILALAGGTPE